MENRFVRKVMVTGSYGSCRAVRSCTGKVGFGKAWLGYGKMENVEGGQSVPNVRKVKFWYGHAGCGNVNYCFNKLENIEGGQSALDVRKVKAMSGIMQSYRAS